MSVTRSASAVRRPVFRSARLAPFVVLAMLLALLGGFRAAAAQASSSPTTPIWSTQLDFDNNGTAWSESFFAGLAADGLTTAELNMPWGTIEPSAGTFSFTEWDQELANASAAGIQLIPIFWQAGWGGSPAPWINDFEQGSGGAAGHGARLVEPDRAVRVLHATSPTRSRTRLPSPAATAARSWTTATSTPSGTSTAPAAATPPTTSPSSRTRTCRRPTAPSPRSTPTTAPRTARSARCRRPRPARRCSACSRRSGRGASSRPTGS